MTSLPTVCLGQVLWFAVEARCLAKSEWQRDAMIVAHGCWANCRRHQRLRAAISIRQRSSRDVAVQSLIIQESATCLQHTSV